MPSWVLYLLIAAAWLTYPFFGAASVAETEPPGNSGFSFLPELIVFPPIFWGVAYAIDSIATPWGRWIVSLLCVIMLVAGTVGFVRNVMALRRIARHK